MVTFPKVNVQYDSLAVCYKRNSRMCFLSEEGGERGDYVHIINL